MAARKRRLTLDDEWRSKIQTSMLINRLNANALGMLETEMSASQIKSAEILLRKVVPDLAAIEHSGEVEHRYVAEVPTRQVPQLEWLHKHGNGQAIQ